jgi:hypothetical protein
VLRRVNALLARGGNVLLFRERGLYNMTALVNRYSQAPLRVVAGLSLLVRAFDDPYFHLEGRLLEALSRLFAQNVASTLTRWRLLIRLSMLNGPKRTVACQPNSCISNLLSLTSIPTFSRAIFSYPAHSA